MLAKSSRAGTTSYVSDRTAPFRPGRPQPRSSAKHAVGRELASVAGVTPQTASSHLSKMVKRELLAEKRERPAFVQIGHPTGRKNARKHDVNVVAATGPPAS
jgi:hypothetical protein